MMAQFARSIALSLISSIFIDDIEKLSRYLIVDAETAFVLYLLYKLPQFAVEGMFRQCVGFSQYH